MNFSESDIDHRDCVKDRILSAAGVIFADKGFRCATVREICDAADANIASVNYYFGDKKTLYTDTLLLARKIGANQFPTPEFAKLDSAQERLRQMVLLLLNRLVANQIEPWPVKILMAEILSPSAAATPLIDGYIRPFMNVLFDTVEELLDSKATEKQIHQVGFSIVAQCLYYRFAEDLNRMIVGDVSYAENFTVNCLAKQIYDFSLAGIRQLNQQLAGDRQSRPDAVAQASTTAV